MNKKIISILFIFVLIFGCIVPAFGFSNELIENEETFTIPEPITDENGNQKQDLSILFRGAVDKSMITGSASVMLMVRCIEDGTTFEVPLYSRNDYIYKAELNKPGYYEIYKAFYNSTMEGLPETTFPVEYVRFYHPGDRPISVYVILGDSNKLDVDELPNAFRVNSPGKPYKNYPTNIASTNVSYYEFLKFGDKKLNEERNEVLTEETTKKIIIGDFFEGSTVDTSKENHGKNEFEYNEDGKYKGIVALVVAIFIMIVGIVYYLKKIKK